MAELTIGRLADEAGVNVETIRYYQRRGLIPEPDKPVMTELHQPPGYDQVVETFNLEILKQPGDLVVKDGDLALARGGDLMLKDERYSAMFRLVQHWRFNAPTLEALFDLVIAARRRRTQLDENLNQIKFFDPAHPDAMFDPKEIARFHALNDEVGASELSAEVCAASIVLVLSGLLLALKTDLQVPRELWEQTEPKFGGWSVGAILVASANNFRHREEWAKSPIPMSQQLPSIKILAAALNESIAPSGAGHGMSREISLEILDMLSSGNLRSLSERIFAFAHNLALATPSNP